MGVMGVMGADCAAAQSMAISQNDGIFQPVLKEE